ncbi:MAG: 16S rRNA (uracil(1498)-N(3))-methyltransferase [Actinomyces sp.]|nr:MAG: 16S rRNA (uracil(1498)-N(3))-methyltransferase [Actinomyces sp.]
MNAATVPGSGPHLLVADIEVPELDEGEQHHLRRVLRLGDGALVTVGDGRGRWRRAVLAGDALEVTGPVESVARPHPPVTVAFALVKGERPEWIVQKLTEVGVDVIVPLVAARSVVRWDERRRAHQSARLARIVEAAVRQCRRLWAPTLGALTPFDELVGMPGAVLAAPDGSPPRLDPDAGVTVLVGPEGGWAPDELARARSRVALGPHVLRAETAAVTAGVLHVALREHLVAPGDGAAS